MGAREALTDREAEVETKKLEVVYLNALEVYRRSRSDDDKAAYKKAMDEFAAARAAAEVHGSPVVFAPDVLPDIPVVTQKKKRWWN